MIIAIAVILFYLAAQLIGSYAIRQLFFQQIIDDLKPQAQAIAAQYAVHRNQTDIRQPYIIQIFDADGNATDPVLSGNNSQQMQGMHEKIALSLQKKLPGVLDGNEVSYIGKIKGLEQESLVIGVPMTRGTTVIGAVFLLKPASDYQVVLGDFAVIFAITMLAGVLLFGILLQLYLKELKQLEQVRREYVANVSHELKSPISSIKALTETLADGLAPDPETQQRYYGIILSESNRLQKMITEILELSRLQSGKVVIERHKTDPAGLMRMIEAEYTVLAEDLGITFSVTQAAQNMPPLFTNEDRLLQILHILINNALKFTQDNGTVTVDADIRRSQVILRVTDNGIGIAKDALPYVFDRFYKDDSMDHASGSGLGLSIAKELLDAMGERISVVSEPGKGASFSFSVKRSL